RSGRALAPRRSLEGGPRSRPRRTAAVRCRTLRRRIRIAGLGRIERGRGPGHGGRAVPRTPPLIPVIPSSPQRKQGWSLLPRRVRRMILLGIISCALPAVVRASSPAFDASRVLAEAESAFARGKATEDPVKACAEFARAAMLYAQLRGSNPDLHLNEGNAQ